MNSTLFYTLILLGLLVSQIGSSQRAFAGASLDQLWRAVQEHSYALRAELTEVEAAGLELSRGKNHWLPKLSLSATAVSTDSPAHQLFATLGSRSLLATDLSPGTVNDPTRQWFKSGSLTLSLPLYEGGARVSMLQAAEFIEQSQLFQKRAKVNEVYSRLVKLYVTVLMLKQEHQDLLALNAKLQKVISNYRVGSKNNPVGYSGLLGMKALLNRLESALALNQNQVLASVDAIRSLSGVNELSEKDFQDSSALTLAQERLSTSLADPAPPEGTKAVALKLASQGQAQFAQIQKSKWKPQLGLFASQGLVSGPRDTGWNTEYGAYLQWQLFDGSNLGSYREASLRAQATENRATQVSEDVRLEKETLQKTLPILLENLGRLEQSSQLTSEQTNTTEMLFKNGSVNALQFSEVLARRADLIESKKQLETAVLEALVQEYNLQ